MPIKLSNDTAAQMKASIKRYFKEHLDEPDTGDLKAGMLLDFCLKEICPTIYNQAIVDAQKYFQERVVDLEGVCYEKEFGYWPLSTSPRGRPRT
jgi:uncharacterized protein (DUF2164 family)